MADPAPMILHVCTTCRDADPAADRPSAGARLHAHVAAAVMDPAIQVAPVECLSVCKRTCCVSFSAPGKWTYVYGDLPPEMATAATILEGARLYAETSDGLIPWKQRPAALKTGVIARVPPLPVTP